MHIDYHELIWAIINFSVLLAILYKFLYGPLLKVMENRQNEIKNNISQAEEIRNEAEVLRAQLKQEMEKARSDARETMEKAVKTAEETKNQIISEAKDTANNIVVKAQEEIQREKEQALADIRNEVASLAILAAGKVIGKTMTAEEHDQLVDKYIQEVGEIQ